MNTFVKSALIALSLAVAGVGASASTASARDASFSIYFGSSGGGYHFGDRDHRGRWHHRDHRGHRHFRGHRDHRRACSPRQALRKASRLGLHHARIVDIDRRTIEVRGKRRGDHIRAVFSRRPSCPVVALR